MINKKEFTKLCKTSKNRNIELLDYFYKEYKTLSDNQQTTMEIMLECSSEELDKILKLIRDDTVRFYEDYHNLMYEEGRFACGFICNCEISEEIFNSLYDEGMIDDDRIYNCIKINHTVYHKRTDDYTEPYVVWFS